MSAGLQTKPRAAVDGKVRALAKKPPSAALPTVNDSPATLSPAPVQAPVGKDLSSHTPMMHRGVLL